MLVRRLFTALVLLSIPTFASAQVCNGASPNVCTVNSSAYYVTVEAMNACGASGASNTVAAHVSVTGTPAAPSNVRAMVNGNSVTLSWDAVPGAASCVIEAGFTPGAINAAFPIGPTTVTAPGVPRGTYYVRVRAIGAAGASAPSAENVVVVP